MDRDTILATLRAHETELKAAGIEHLRLFGSVARGDHGPASDVDLLADYDETKRLSIFTVIGHQYLLTDLLGAEVHLTMAESMRPNMQKHVLPEAILAF